MGFSFDPAASSVPLTEVVDGTLAAQLGCADTPGQSPTAPSVPS
jgi:hypothetical protein